MYKETNNGAILRLSDNLYIPKVTGNKDYDEYMLWLKEGNFAQKTDLEEIKIRKLSDINVAAQSTVVDMMKTYPPFEIQTWPQQQTEAMAWDKDKDAQTLFLDTVAQARGVVREVLLQKTLEKVIAFRDISAFLAGTRQKYEDMVDAATSIQEVEDIEVNFTIPG